VWITSADVPLGGGKNEMKLARSLTRSSIEHKSRRESIVKIANYLLYIGLLAPKSAKGQAGLTASFDSTIVDQGCKVNRKNRKVSLR
jgi:hypothetical protein